MISEVLNSLWMTYVASEYLIFESALSSRRDSGIVAFLRARGTALGILSTFVLVINILDHHHHHLVRLPEAASVRKLFNEFRSVAKIGFAVSAYLLGLYCDVHRLAPRLSVRQFAGKISWALLRHAPAYPLLAVLISFGFLFVITIWDMIGLPDEWLNAPIYYGTLYGPLAVLYVTVKRQVVYESTSLPA